MGAENCGCKRACTDLNSNLDLSREANPVYEQFYGGVKLNLNIGKYDASEDNQQEVFDFSKFRKEDANSIRMMIENKHAPSSAIAKYLVNVPDYKNVVVEEAVSKYGIHLLK